MARTTISIPDNIKKQMDEVTESVNWSSVATGAFIQKLGELASEAKEKNMLQVIQRLQATKQKHEDYRQKLGFRLGYEWAKNHASYDELVRLSEFNIEVYNTAINEDAGYSAATDIALASQGLLGNQDANANDEREYFWEKVTDDMTQINNLDFLGGFIEGAEKLYLEVADQLN